MTSRYLQRKFLNLVARAEAASRPTLLPAGAGVMPDWVPQTATFPLLIRLTVCTSCYHQKNNDNESSGDKYG